MPATPTSGEVVPVAASAEPVVQVTGPPIKIIFLDIDGVICCNGAGRLETDKMKRIASVVEKTGAKVVLSTDWRRDASLKAVLTKALTDVGVTVIGATRKGAPMKPIRPQEITGWLDAFLERGRDVSEWVAVDDRELLGEMGGERLKGHFVNTNFASGLTDLAAERLVAVLSGDHEQGMGAFTRNVQTKPRLGTPGKKRGATPPPSRPSPTGKGTPGGRPAVPATRYSGDAAAAPGAATPAKGGFNAAAAPGGMHSSLRTPPKGSKGAAAAGEDKAEKSKP